MQRQLESLICKINDDTMTIGQLLNEKKEVINNLYTALEIKRRSKVALKESQIDAFSKFMSYYENEKKNINEQFWLIRSGQYLNSGKDLHSLDECQANILQKIKEVVDEGEGVLELITKTY